MTNTRANGLSKNNRRTRIASCGAQRPGRSTANIPACSQCKGSVRSADVLPIHHGRLEGGAALVRHKEGMALLVVTMFIAVAMIILGALSMRVINQSHQTGQYERYRACFYGLETAFAASLVGLEFSLDGQVGLTSNWESLFEPDAENPFPGFDDPAVEPLTLTSHPQVEYYAFVTDWSDDGVDNFGDGTVDGPNEEDWYTIHTFARWGATQRRAEAIVRSDDVNVWRNAIFAGSGQAGGLINGNVSIHGAVHLLGDNVVEGGTSIHALDLSGTSLVHNNYDGMPNTLRQMIPDPPQTRVDGELVETLNATLRVRNGLVALSGNSEVGQPEPSSGSGFKGPMDGTYVNDGWCGNSTIDDGDRGVPTMVWSDNGWNQLYDLGDRVPFPWLDHDYREPGTGARVYNASEARNYTHEEYFTEVLTGAPYEGDISINARHTSEFYYNASNPASTSPGERLSTDNYIYYDGDSKVLEINGPVLIDGNIEIDGQGNQRTIHYTGRGAWLARGDVNLGANLFSMNADGSTVNSFPVNNALGIMAEGDMMVGEDAQLTLMGAFYAQGQITSQRQTNVVGTFVSNFFDMGTNVPSIFQVPALADNLPRGMIGDYPIRNMSMVSWREL